MLSIIGVVKKGSHEYQCGIAQFSLVREIDMLL
jgi:hypothetical protein